MRSAPHDPAMPLRSAESHLFDALAFAAHKHRDQRRKDAHASPYINHPIALAHLLSVEGGVTDTHTLVAAVLHDTIEDTETTYDELRERFGKVVADVVAEVTDDKVLPKDERKRLQVVHAPHKSRRAALVKLADKTWNLRDMADNPPVGWPLERRREYFDWARSVVDGLPPVSKRLRQVFDAAYARRP
jgi:GTP diphosphokinase / guanosine-3',5'-bis(diphosphate) 3'-diphosphatase